ncbi:protein NDR1-like [Corylus avellana]|uniref:protein NDR1-like n=1 Tax=Corylus avellana TaxID=13451 RepID=UPI001E1F5371|nr:protein NDR1-like [Corylus avellana]
MAESSGCGCCCKCCLRLIISIGVLSLIVWLTLRADTPKCSIQYFYLPALNKTLNTPKNNTLLFELRLQNTNKDKGVYYDALNLTFYDNPNRSLSHIIGTYTIPAFYQGHQKKAKRRESVKVNNTLVLGSGLTNGPPVFRVDLATAVRFKNIFWKWKSKRHKLVVAANVEVNEQGVKVNKKGIKLKSGAPENGYCDRAQVGVLLGLMVLVLLNFR